MARVREWTDEEVHRLTELYTSNKTFDEIILEFPSRSSNAIRLKASRLGLKRPNLLLSLIQTKKVRFQSNGIDAAKGFLIKCNDCGSWIQTDDLNLGAYQIIRCSECGSIYEVLADS
ncbi:MAG: hypothetical protein NWE89_10550 [Candidatus Bathyarchaeota archaeon]|nr:hypothetical protein [Candidatus Bathyarchaeota archaeon]